MSLEQKAFRFVLGASSTEDTSAKRCRLWRRLELGALAELPLESLPEECKVLVEMAQEQVEGRFRMGKVPQNWLVERVPLGKVNTENMVNLSRQGKDTLVDLASLVIQTLLGLS